ncbi:diacylglycerol kinase family protein [Aquibacillus albus]|uniref:Diacylglycerol kinase n=1 Tax=Aquibacillus albus TaxID=1168171 RepID=A0ABS2MUT1_9BACI|nr:diacylglycerol kinase family protein [Aquibacillus albus]MBM7569630.1 diacylglycerol kinase [Aquibacillus albus]
MSSDYQGNKNKRVGFEHAINGVKEAIKSERNLKIQMVISVIVTIMGIILHITPVEWAIIIITIGLVLSFEIMNTAIEKVMDYLAPEFNSSVGLIKDISAGAVFIAACTSVIVGSIIFLPKLFRLFF